MGSRRVTHDAFTTARDRICQELAEQALPSLAVAVARDGRILWEEAFGWADRENRIPATPHTMYSLASTTKPITATGLMILNERGLLELDRPIADYLGDAKLRARAGEARAATVHRVADHTAGLPLHYQFFYEDEPYQRPPMEETIRRYGNLVTAPGERWWYSNLGYGIIGHVISRVSGMTYAEFLREEVFLPLGMSRSSVGVEPGLGPFAAIRYGSDGVAYPPYETDTPGASAVYSSVHDLVRFAMFHLRAHLPDQAAILPGEAIAGMQRPTAHVGGTRGYGIGWWTNEDIHGYRTVSHAGSMGGASASLWMIPSEKLAVAALSNASSELPYTIVDHIFAALLPPYAEHLEQDRAETDTEAGGTENPAPGFELSRALAGEWYGSVHTYEGETPLRMRFKKTGGVRAQIGGQPDVSVTGLRFDGGQLRGEMLGSIATPDVIRLPHHLRLDLGLRGDAINGAAIAVSVEHGEGGAPGMREGYALSHWTELKRRA